MRINRAMYYPWVSKDLSPRRRLILVFAELGDGRIGIGHEMSGLCMFIQTSDQKATRLMNKMVEEGLLVYGPCNELGQYAWALPKVGLGK